MVKSAILLLALAAVAVAKPLGGAVVSENHHVSSSVVSPHLGLGYGLMGYPAVVGHTISSHSVAHAVPHFGLGMKGLAMAGLYPGGIGLGYGLMG